MVSVDWIPESAWWIRMFMSLFVKQVRLTHLGGCFSGCFLYRSSPWPFDCKWVEWLCNYRPCDPRVQCTDHRPVNHRFSACAHAVCTYLSLGTCKIRSHEAPNEKFRKKVSVPSFYMSWTLPSNFPWKKTHGLVFCSGFFVMTLVLQRDSLCDL